MRYLRVTENSLSIIKIYNGRPELALALRPQGSIRDYKRSEAEISQLLSTWRKPDKYGPAGSPFYDPMAEIALWITLKDVRTIFGLDSDMLQTAGIVPLKGKFPRYWLYQVCRCAEHFRILSTVKTLNALNNFLSKNKARE